MKKGFTLVELLAVIVILAVILVIAVPQINNVIKQTKTNSLASTAKLIAAKAEEATVENEILESNEALTCANLVKLDDNYGSCSVSVTNGVATVTLNGTGKFAGLTCTGTKGNMSCTEGSGLPEYVYGIFKPHHYYTYTVKEGKNQECKTYLENNVLDTMVNILDYTEETAQSEIEAVCSNSNIYDDPTNPYSASDWFNEAIKRNMLAYEDISSFVERSGSGELVDGIENYTEISYHVFIKWKVDELDSSFSNEHEVCTLYGGNLTCFRYTGEYSDDANAMIELFGSENCSTSQNEMGFNILTCEDGPYSCKRGTTSITCKYGNESCSIDRDGIAVCASR